MVTYLFGAWDLALEILMIFMILDYITGCIRGAVNKELSSSVGLKGIARKCIILAVLIVAASLDKLLNPGNWVFRSLICYFYISNEGLSIIENSASLGLPIPNKLREMLIQLRYGGKKGDKQ